MQIELFPYERIILETLEKEYDLDRELVIGLALSLNQLSRLFDKIIQGEYEYHAGLIVIIGFINHTHHLIIGGLQALEDGNGHVWSACFRGLIEIFGACEKISESPANTLRFLDDKNHITPGKLVEAADHAKRGLKNDYKRLSNIVHPSSGAIYAGWKMVDLDACYSKFRFGLYKETAEDVQEGVTVLANLAGLIVDNLQQLSIRDEIMNIGKIAMQRNAENHKKCIE